MHSSGKDYHIHMRLIMIAALFTVTSFTAEAPSVSADLGPCSARFTVTDGTKPLYNARIHTRIKHGAFGMRKLDLEVGTDANGQAQMTRLPNRSKYPITFDISRDEVSRTVLFEPEKQCDAQFEVQLRKPLVPTTPPATEQP